MVQVIVAVGVVVAAVIVGQVVRARRRVDVPTQPRVAVPVQLDRGDFPGPDGSALAAPWIVVAFTSATCSTCADVARKAQVLATEQVAVVEVEYMAAQAVHRKYEIDGVPIVAIADREGVVRASFTGPVTATDLWAAVARARDADQST